MSFQSLFVIFILALVIVALIKDRMRPGLVLLSGAVIFMCAGILSPRELLEGFSNKGMITVALLFLVSEGVRQSGLLSKLLERLLPRRGASVRKVQLCMLPMVSFISAFLNNTPVVVIFAPMIKRWAERMNLSPTKFLIPLSYATILGGVCTLIGTSTNLVVHGMVIDAGYEGFTMFELGKVGLIIAVVGLVYIVIASKYLLPDRRDASEEDTVSQEKQAGTHRVEVVLGARFPAINRRVRDFDFENKYGATILEIRRGGQTIIMHDMRKERFREGDTLVLLADDAFMKNWGDSSFFLMVSNGKEAEPQMSRRKSWLAIILLVLMIVGATVGELPAMKDLVPGMKFDMFFFVCVTTVIMAWLNIFPARKYTKYVSWDILVTIASAFAISRAMQNSGMADAVAQFAIGLSHNHGPLLLLAVVFIITNLFTELMTNNAAAALAFPISLAIAEHLGVSPMPFFVTICIAASASFSSPIGYQTNLIVQGIGNYRFGDFVKVGLPLNFICLILTVLLVPMIWPF
ncbi:MAG: SLC13 family permease [Bacteroidales bacterium]|nr:SLC13 family permease [Bacteroidales bacterium]